jgi:hypothetical protein
MSATGFQRRRRELAKADKQSEQNGTDVGTGGTEKVPPVNPQTTPGTQVPGADQKTGLAALSKDKLLAFIGKRKLFEKSYSSLEPEAIIPLFLKEVQGKIVTAKLKTDIEVSAMPEKELLELFATLK